MGQIQIIPQQASHELAEVLDGLTRLNQSGEIALLVFGVAFKGQRYYFDVAGPLHGNQVLAIGVAAKLTAELDRRLDRRSEDTVF